MYGVFNTLSEYAYFYIPKRITLYIVIRNGKIVWKHWPHVDIFA